MPGIVALTVAAAYLCLPAAWAAAAGAGEATAGVVDNPTKRVFDVLFEKLVPWQGRKVAAE
jgi:hypothetical protein